MSVKEIVSEEPVTVVLNHVEMSDAVRYYSIIYLAL